VPYRALVQTPTEKFTPLMRKQLLDDHRIFHAWYASIKASGKPMVDQKTGEQITLEEVSRRHAKTVRKMFELGFRHCIVDELDETLPLDLKKRSEQTESNKTLTDFSSLALPALLQYHYACHKIWRLTDKGSEPWSSEIKTKQDIIDFHRRVVEEMLRRDVVHMKQDDLDDFLPDEMKSLKDLTSSLTLLSRWLYTHPRRTGWIIEAGSLLKHLVGPRVLELGCSGGDLLDSLGASGYYAEGVDIDEGALKVCEARGLQTTCSDIYDYLKQCPDNSFNTICSLHTIEHLDNAKQVLEQCLRVASDASVHVVPLGKGRCEDHQIEWENEYHLRSWLSPLPYSVDLLPTGEAILCAYPSLPKELQALASLPSLTTIPDYVSVVGSGVQGGKQPNDWDILVRRKDRDMDLETQIASNLRRMGFPTDQLEIIYRPEGPHGPYLPLYHKVLLRAPNPTIHWPSSLKSSEEIKQKPRIVGSYFPPLKPALQFSSFEEAWDQWGKEKVKETGRVFVEQKCDGFRVRLNFCGKGNSIWASDSPDDVSSKFPTLKQELLTVRGGVIDGEAVLAKSSGEIASREELASIFMTKGVDPREKNVVILAYDILCLDHEWLDTQTYSERREILAFFLKANPQLKHVKLLPTAPVTTKEQFLSAAEQVSKPSWSEGAMFKADTIYHWGETTADWAKVKVVSEVLCKVTGKHQIAGGPPTRWVYELAVTGPNGEEVSCGNSMATVVDAPVGSILEIRVDRAWKNEDGTYSLLLPRPVELRKDKHCPSTTRHLDTLVKTMSKSTSVFLSFLDFLTSSAKRAAAKFKKKVKDPTPSTEEGKPLKAEDWMGLIQRGDRGRWTFQVHTWTNYHGDLRFEIPGTDAFCKYTLFIPNKLCPRPADRSGYTAQACIDCAKKLLDHLLQGGSLAGDYTMNIGSKKWLDIGIGTPTYLPAGGSGAGKEDFAWMYAADYGTYEAGPVFEDHHSAFYLLNGQVIKNRWLMVVGVKPSELRLQKPELAGGEQRVWLFHLLDPGSTPTALKEEEAEKEIKIGKYTLVDKKVEELGLNELTHPHQGGRFRGVSVGRDKNGYFVATHRARSPSFPSPDKIPRSYIRFIESTGSLSNSKFDPWGMWSK